MNPGWAFLKPTPGVAPPPSHPSQPQARRAPQVEPRVPSTAGRAPHPALGAGLGPARPRPPQAPGQGPSMTHPGAPRTQTLGRQRLPSIFVSLDHDASSFSPKSYPAPNFRKKPGGPFGKRLGQCWRGRVHLEETRPSHPTAKQLGLFQAESFTHGQNLGWGAMGEGEKKPQDLESEAARTPSPSLHQPEPRAWEE